MRRFSTIILITVLILAGVYYNNLIKTTKDSSDHQHIVVYFIRSTPTNFLLVPVTRAVEQATPRHALKLLIAGPTDDEDLSASVPKETRVNNVIIKNGLATVDFSQEIREFFNGGSQLEAHLVDAIYLTLIQFNNINQVQILLDGQKTDSIGGHVLIENPLPY